MRKLIVGLVLVCGALGASACPEKGPMEKAGAKMDKAVDKATHPNETALEKAGRKTDEAIDKAKDAAKDATKQ